MKIKALKTYVREAYLNRYAYDRVTVDAAGVIRGCWNRKPQRYDVAPTVLGHIADCRTVITDTGVRFYNRHMLVYTFAR